SRLSGSQSNEAGQPQPTRNGTLTIPIFCRRDDYMFLPPNALGGIPCLSVPSNQHFDARALAVRIAAEEPAPEGRSGGNSLEGVGAVAAWGGEGGGADVVGGGGLGGWALCGRARGARRAPHLPSRLDSGRHGVGRVGCDRQAADA